MCVEVKRVFIMPDIGLMVEFEVDVDICLLCNEKITRGGWEVIRY